MIATSKRRIALFAAVVLAGAAGGAYAVGERPFTPARHMNSHYGDWSPGASARVAALSALPRVSSPPAGLVRVVQRAVLVTHGNATLALRTLRELRTGLGAGNDSIYVYEPAAGAACVVLWNRAASCPTASKSILPGVEWFVAGGYPRSPSADLAEVPSAFAAVVDDRVESVALVSGDGGIRNLRIENNAVFFELDSSLANAPWDARVRVEYRDGSRKEIPLG
jgi:hypothetical protein